MELARVVLEKLLAWLWFLLEAVHRVLVRVLRDVANLSFVCVRRRYKRRVLGLIEERSVLLRHDLRLLLNE